ncbi:MAG: peptidoglycan-associated lipoprotein Pal [bacterium]|nr:peptidoglycan-associated lipoprotein Pal [bacterium]
MMGSRDADYYMQQRVLKNIYFALDKHDLTEEARSTLKNNSTWLKAHDEFGIVVEGHCDERGSIEYNLALGERRANAVREYLTDLGIDHSRMRLVSYGEERPVADGSSESAWSQNRRAAFIIEER